MNGVSLRKTTACQVCKGTDLRVVLDLGNHPLCDDLIRVGDARIATQYPIQVLLCPRCLTANQAFNVPKEDLFNDAYHYRAHLTKDVVMGMDQLVGQLSGLYGSLEGKKVMDIGCNDGSLLSIFSRHGAQTFGVEPTGAHRDADPVHRIWPSYFDVGLAETIRSEAGKMDFICFTNVFAHIEDFDQMIEAVRRLSDAGTKVVIENHYLGAVLDRNQFDTFYHEHPRTYSLRSFSFVAEQLGMNIEHLSFPKRYGGNIRVVLGHGGEMADLASLSADEEAYFGQFEEMNRYIANWKEQKRREIQDLSRVHGPLTAKAFPGRAAILIKLLDLNSDHIGRVTEKPGSMKIGHYVPGTRIPIVSDADVDYAKQSHVLNLAWHIKSEILDYLRSRGFQGEMINIL